MPTVKDLGESKYLAKEDVGTGKIVTITGWDKQDVSRDCDPTSIKYILKFEECKPLVLNKTNGKKIAKIAGSDNFEDWIGKKIVLWNNPDVEFQGETTGGIRVRDTRQHNVVKQAALAAEELGDHYDGSQPTPANDSKASSDDDDDIPF